MKALIKLQLDVGKTEYEAAIARFETAKMVAIGLIVFSLVCGIAIGAWLIRGITRALGRGAAHRQQRRRRQPDRTDPHRVER